MSKMGLFSEEITQFTNTKTSSCVFVIYFECYTFFNIFYLKKAVTFPAANMKHIRNNFKFKRRYRTASPNCNCT